MCEWQPKKIKILIYKKVRELKENGFNLLIKYQFIKFLWRYYISLIANIIAMKFMMVLVKAFGIYSLIIAV